MFYYFLIFFFYFRILANSWLLTCWPRRWTRLRRVLRCLHTSQCSTPARVEQPSSHPNLSEYLPLGVLPPLLHSLRLAPRWLQSLQWCCCILPIPLHPLTWGPPLSPIYLSRFNKPVRDIYLLVEHSSLRLRLNPSSSVQPTPLPANPASPAGCPTSPWIPPGCSTTTLHLRTLPQGYPTHSQERGSGRSRKDQFLECKKSYAWFAGIAPPVIITTRSRVKDAKDFFGDRLPKMRDTPTLANMVGTVRLTCTWDGSAKSAGSGSAWRLVWEKSV